MSYKKTARLAKVIRRVRKGLPSAVPLWCYATFVENMMLRANLRLLNVKFTEKKCMFWTYSQQVVVLNVKLVVWQFLVVAGAATIHLYQSWNFVFAVCISAGVARDEIENRNSMDKWIFSSLHYLTPVRPRVCMWCAICGGWTAAVHYDEDFY